MASYLILYGSEILFQAGNDNRPLHSAKLSSKMGVDQLTFTVPPEHPLRHSMRIRDLENSVTVSYGDQPLFCGFITRMTEQIDGQLAVTCASDAQLLADVHVRVSERLSAQALFTYVIGRYNQLMTAIGYDGRHEGLPDRTFDNYSATIDYGTVGFIDPTLETDPPTYVLGTVGTSPTPILDILVNGIVQPYDCLLKVWRKDGKRSIAIDVAEIGMDVYEDEANHDGVHFDKSGQSVIFGENMTSYESDSSDEGFYNGCCPLGATKRDENGGHVGGRWLRIVSDVTLGADVLGLATMDGSTILIESNSIVVANNIAYTVTADKWVDPDGELVPISPVTPHSYPSGGRAWLAGDELVYLDSTVTLDRLDDGTYGDDGEPRASEAAGGRWMVNGNVVYNIESVRQYGLRTYTFSDSEIEDERGLLRRAIKEIQSQQVMKHSVSVDAVDMAFYKDGYSHLLIGQIVQVVPRGLGQSMPMRVMEADIDLGNPSATRYTLGKMPDGLMERIGAARAETEALRDNLVHETNNVIPQSFIGGLT